MIAVRMLPSDNRHICHALDLNFGFGEYGILEEVVFDANCQCQRDVKCVGKRKK